MDHEKLLREIRIVACTVLVGILCARVATLPDFTHTTDAVNNSVNKLGVVLDKASSLEDSAGRFGHKLALDYDDPAHPYDGLYYNLQNDFYNSQQASKHLDDMVIAANNNLNGPEGVFSNVNVLLNTVDNTVKSLSTDLNKLTTSTSEVLLPLKASLSNVDVLTKELAEELKSGGNIDQTVTKLNSNLDSVNVLLSDPSVIAILQNSAEITEHLGSAANTVDIVMMPYRKKISQIHWLLNKIVDMIKVTVPIF